MEDNALQAGVEKLGQLSLYTCPECHGALLQMMTGGLLRFRCHTGHAYTLNSLLAELTVSIEGAFWNALRAAQESVMLLRHISEHLRQSGEAEAAEAFAREVEKVARQADLARLAITSPERPPGAAQASDGPGPG